MQPVLWLLPVAVCCFLLHVLVCTGQYCGSTPRSGTVTLVCGAEATEAFVDVEPGCVYTMTIIGQAFCLPPPLGMPGLLCGHAAA